MSKLVIKNISKAILPFNEANFALLPSKEVDLCQILNESDIKVLKGRTNVIRLLETGRIVIIEENTDVNHVLVDEQESNISNVFDDPENQPPQIDYEDLTAAELKKLCREKGIEDIPNTKKKILELLNRSSINE